MQIARTLEELSAWRQAQTSSVGFVPTMGYLHEGHLSLVDRALEDCACCVASIFVNPTQFGANEDLARYPRNLDRDQALLQKRGCQLLFLPDSETIYPSDFQTWVALGPLAQPLEGVQRPGHFRGMATVVLKLLGMTRATHAYFGQKDAQQLALVQQMVRDFNVPVHIVACPTMRDPDGLALSSRNAYLSPRERSLAPALYQALHGAWKLWQGGERSGIVLQQSMERTIKLLPEFQLEYARIVSTRTFQDLEQAQPPALLCIAARLGKTRLIDNMPLTEEP